MARETIDAIALFVLNSLLSEKKISENETMNTNMIIIVPSSREFNRSCSEKVAALMKFIDITNKKMNKGHTLFCIG